MSKRHTKEATQDIKMITLDVLKNEFTTWLESLNYAPRTIECYHDETVLFLRWLYVKHEITTSDMLMREHLLNWQKHLFFCRNQKKQPLSPKTINRKIASIRKFFEYLVLKGHLLKNMTDVLRLVKEPKLLPQGVMSHGKIKRVLSKIPTGDPIGYRNRTMLEMLYSTAIRARELLGLDVTSLDLKNATATVFGKGRKERVVPLGKTAMRYLKTYINGVRPFLLIDRNERALFISLRGSRLVYRSLLTVVHKYCDVVKDVNVTPHTFRRSCTTELIKGGANIYHVKDMLGHESLETLQPYINLTIIDLKKTHAKCHPREKDN